MILADPRDAGWFYLFVAIESLLMRPADSSRAVWAVMRRGAPHVMAVFRTAAIQIGVVLIGSYVLALVVRLAFRRHNAKLEMGTYAAILPWLYAPKMLLTLAVAVLWALQIAPDDAMTFSGVTHLQPWAIGYHALALGLVGWSLRAFFATHTSRFDWSSDERDRRVLDKQRVIVVALFAIAASAVGARAHLAPHTFRPIGKGDRAPAMHFRPMLAAPAVDVTFPRERPVVIDFWATWCAPCLDALPAWESMYQRRDTIGADFVSANVELDNEAEARTFVNARGLRFPVHVADATTQGIFQVTTLPTVVVLSEKGEILEYWIGGHDERDVVEALRR